MSDRPFLHRYELDQTRPTFGQALKDLGARSLPGAIALFAVLLGLGFLIVGPLHSLKGEDDVNRWLQTHRGPAIDSVTQVFSIMGNTEYAIGICLVVIAVVWWRTKQWWYAVLPGIAMALQAMIFVPVTNIVDRERPIEGPGLAHLDPAPPTASYPSGHTGAAFALYITVALMAQRIQTPWLRRLVTTVAVILPFLVFFARVFRGMHHVSDCTVGMLNGLICMLLAWRYLRRDEGGTTRPDRSPAATSAA
ncbi:MAG TPA: phosphatase PAP2 family protein [Dermatophilaceae bacterium]|nr:phosphatase PAP2 family protein [Dermatophilaceae bacterium]